VARIEQAPGVSRIDRRNRQEEAKVTADLLPGFAQGSVQAQIDAWIAKEGLVPQGVQALKAGQAEVQARESGFMLAALGIGIVLVYMLLAALYDNLLYPFIIQLATPQAITGAILALVITDKPFGLVGFIGIITLMGPCGQERDPARGLHEHVAGPGEEPSRRAGGGGSDPSAADHDDDPGAHPRHAAHRPRDRARLRVSRDDRHHDHRRHRALDDADPARHPLLVHDLR
jgi:hypothetical protein